MALETQKSFALQEIEITNGTFPLSSVEDATSLVVNTLLLFAEEETWPQQHDALDLQHGSDALDLPTKSLNVAVTDWSVSSAVADSLPSHYNGSHPAGFTPPSKVTNNDLKAAPPPP